MDWQDWLSFLISVASALIRIGLVVLVIKALLRYLAGA